mgnify:CR=1 FL=1
MVIFDCESDCGFSSVPGYTRDEKISSYMQFTCICATVIASKLVVRGASPDDIISQATKMVWWRDVAEKGCTPVDSLLELFDSADVIVGYNCLAFDFPLIRRFYKSRKDTNYIQRYMDHRCKTLDVMARVRDISGVYYKLDNLLLENGMPTKISDGSNAVRMWDEGRRCELEEYCASDVELTARLALMETINFSVSHQKLSMQQHAHCIRGAINAKLHP